MEHSSPFVQIVAGCQANNATAEAKAFLTTSARHLSDLAALDHIAELQSQIKDYQGAQETLSRMLFGCHYPAQVKAVRINLAKMCNKQNKPKEALGHLNKLDDCSSTKMERALAEYFMGNYSASKAIMTQLLAECENNSTLKDRILYNLAIYDMQDDFQKGYAQYIEKGHKIQIWPTQQVPMIPEWKGDILPGKTLIIHAEGGIGDEIIAVRFMSKISALGMKPVWKTNNVHLKEVFNRNGYSSVTSIDEIDTFDAVQVMAMFLPIYLGISAHELWSGPYLTASPEYLDKWQKLLPKGNKLAVKWQGNMQYDQDLHRSIPDRYFKKLQFNGTKINLQLEPQQKNSWSHSPDINNLEDTLAIIQLCSITVTSCTCIAHIAGALGVPAIVCPPIAYYHVWCLPDKWYGSNLRVIKQTSVGCWRNVFDRVQHELNQK